MIHGQTQRRKASEQARFVYRFTFRLIGRLKQRTSQLHQRAFIGTRAEVQNLGLMMIGMRRRHLGKLGAETRLADARHAANIDQMASLIVTGTL